MNSPQCIHRRSFWAGFVLVAGLICPGTIPAQSRQAGIPWDMTRLGQAPKWTVLERPKMEGVKAICYSGRPFKGKPTRVFAWLGVPKMKPGEKVPAMVLIHGGGGTAFEEWVSLWVGRGYAAIAMDTCGQVPVGNYGQWFHDEQGGPAGWGGFDQINGPREDQWRGYKEIRVSGQKRG